jgi:hypothetical protein
MAKKGPIEEFWDALIKKLPGGYAISIIPWEQFSTLFPGDDNPEVKQEIFSGISPSDPIYISKTRGLEKGYNTIARFSFEESTLWIYPECFETLEPLFKDALKKAGYGEIQIVQGK